MEQASQKPHKVVIGDMKKRCEDILVSISWGHIAARYFHKPSSWLYQKMDGIDGNGGADGFTPEEADRLRGALCDLADRLRRAADNI